MPISLIYKELNLLIDDYYKCPFTQTKEQIILDINLLTEALLLMDQQLESSLESI